MRVRVCARARMRVHLRVRERVAYLPTTVTTRQNFARRGLRRVCRLLGAETFTVIIGGCATPGPRRVCRLLGAETFTVIIGGRVTYLP